MKTGHGRSGLGCTLRRNGRGGAQVAPAAPRGLGRAVAGEEGLPAQAEQMVRGPARGGAADLVRHMQAAGQRVREQAHGAVADLQGRAQDRGRADHVIGQRLAAGLPARAWATGACLCRPLACAALGLLAAGLPGGAAAQDLSGLAAQAASGVSQNAVILVVGLTLLSLAPGLAVMVTCFPFVVTVLSILRQAIGLQQSPPNMLIVSLALFLSWYVMDPVLRDAWAVAGAPLSRGEIALDVAFDRGIEPFRRFMSERTDLDTMAALAEVAPRPDEPRPSLAPQAETGPGDVPDPETAPLSLLVPAFMLTEIERAFAIGFLVSLPFLIIDLVVSAILMSMGMMMVPPTVVALPFKLAFFVAVDGWGLIAAALVRGYQGGG